MNLYIPFETALGTLVNAYLLSIVLLLAGVAMCWAIATIIEKNGN
jgi:hypothetical protein